MIRRGSLLVIAAGLAAIVASMALAFLARATIDGESSKQTSHAIQARLMLAAACQYIQETSRIGWDLSPWSTPTWNAVYPSIPDPDNRIHEETFGWVDVRNGQVGPLTLDYDGDGQFDPRFSAALVEETYPSGLTPDSPRPQFRPYWPAIGGVCRAPMEMWARPPHAISLNMTPNAIRNDSADPWFGLPLLSNPDPQPAFSPHTNTDPAGVAARWQDLRTGNPAIRPESRNLGWFRLHRDGPATFVITVGSGATRGLRDWAEAVAAGEAAAFSDSQDIFDDLRAAEVRLWYRIEWSAAISMQAPTGASSTDAPMWGNLFRLDGSSFPVGTLAYDVRPWTLTRNQGGTISFIQRLRFPPEHW